jgi:hypothetical protein
MSDFSSTSSVANKFQNSVQLTLILLLFRYFSCFRVFASESTDGLTITEMCYNVARSTEKVEAKKINETFIRCRYFSRSSNIRN